MLDCYILMVQTEVGRMSQAPSLYNIPNGQGMEINMLKLIVGVKGTGKTKEIVSLANAAANESKVE